MRALKYIEKARRIVEAPETAQDPARISVATLYLRSAVEELELLRLQAKEAS